MDEFINKINLGDCMNILPKLKSNSISLQLCDPPFMNPSVHYVARDIEMARASYGDLSLMRIAFLSIAREMRRVIKENGHCLVFCDCVTYPIFYEAFYDYFDHVRALVWYKGKNYFSLGKGAWRYSYEMILHAFNKNQFYVQLNRQDMIEYPNVNHQDKNHPAEKPVGLLMELIKAVTNHNDIVLDCFAGSGSTAIAAKRTGRRFIGIEINQQYVDIANKRLLNMPLQLAEFLE